MNYPYISSQHTPPTAFYRLEKKAQHLGAGLKDFLFSSLFGELIQNLTNIFSKGVGSTTN